MQIQLIATLLLSFTLSLSAVADDQKEIAELFTNYSKVMDQHKTDLIDNVFSEKYIKSAGGKEELILKIKELPLRKSMTVAKPELKVQQGSQSSNIFFVKMKEHNFQKGSKKEEYSHSDFVIVREAGKLKIDGTISDGE